MSSLKFMLNGYNDFYGVPIYIFVLLGFSKIIFISLLFGGRCWGVVKLIVKNYSL